MKKIKRFEVGFLSSILFHILIALGLAVFGFFVLPKENTDIVEVTMYQQTSGGDFAPTKSAQQEAPQKPQPQERPIIRKDDIVDTKKTVKEEPKQSSDTPSQNTSQNTSQSAPNTSPSASENGSGGSGGVGNSTGSGNTPDAPPGPPAPPADAGVPVTPPRAVSRPQPPYPNSARNNNQTGTVGIAVVVNSGGGVDSVSVTSSSGYPALDSAAVNGAYRWRFVPAKDRYGSPCVARMNTSVRFSM